MDRGDSNGAALKKSSETTVFMHAHRAILFFRVTFCPTIFHPITSFLFLTIVLLACMILFLALFFVFRADLCVLFFFLLRVYTRVYICFMWFCYIKACVSSCIFSRLLLLLLLRFFATIHCFTFHYCFLFIVFYALSLSCTDMILLGVNCTTGGIRGVWGGRLNNTSGATRRVYNFALYVFSSLLHACSLYIFLYIFLSRSRFFSFLTEHFVFLEKKSKKLVHSRLSRT